eukprot:gb/GECH01014516.1/.p1 GENE.gb/GECH01014516.1/~~gb/GECH01014516.1/.p1  ORF type:complete len:555 (+),score=143.71 gb/GECH01014516.1/:1-1665(+)
MKSKRPKRAARKCLPYQIEQRRKKRALNKTDPWEIYTDTDIDDLELSSQQYQKQEKQEKEKEKNQEIRSPSKKFLFMTSSIGGGHSRNPYKPNFIQNPSLQSSKSTTSNSSSDSSQFSATQFMLRFCKGNLQDSVQKYDKHFRSYNQTKKSPKSEPHKNGLHELDMLEKYCDINDHDYDYDNNDNVKKNGVSDKEIENLISPRVGDDPEAFESQDLVNRERSVPPFGEHTPSEDFSYQKCDLKTMKKNNISPERTKTNSRVSRNGKQTLNRDHHGLRTSDGKPRRKFLPDWIKESSRTQNRSNTNFYENQQIKESNLNFTWLNRSQHSKNRKKSSNGYPSSKDFKYDRNNNQKTQNYSSNDYSFNPNQMIEDSHETENNKNFIIKKNDEISKRDSQYQNSSNKNLKRGEEKTIWEKVFAIPTESKRITIEDEDFSSRDDFDSLPFTNQVYGYDKNAKHFSRSSSESLAPHDNSCESENNTTHYYNFKAPTEIEPKPFIPNNRNEQRKYNFNHESQNYPEFLNSTPFSEDLTKKESDNAYLPNEEERMSISFLLN